MPTKPTDTSDGAPTGAPKLAFSNLYNAHFRKNAEKRPVADFVRDMQRWERWFKEHRKDEDHVQAEHSALNDLAELANAARAALERLMQHRAFDVESRFHRLWGKYPELEKRARWLVPDEIIPLLSELHGAALDTGASDEVQKIHRGRARDTAKYDATFDLISIYEWYSEVRASRSNDFPDFVIAAFDAIGIGDGATGQLQEALKDHPHCMVKPFSCLRN
jgi:hypothetical protein